jgi:hypothetical protein
MTKNEAENCKTKYELYCKIFRDSGYRRTGESIDAIGGFVEEYLNKIGIDGHNLSMNDLKHAVNTCIEERKWKYYRPENQTINDIKCIKPDMTCNKMIALNLNTFALLGGKVHQHDVESAIDKYAAQTGHNIDDEIAVLNLQHRRKNVKLTLHEKYMDWLEQTANGRRIQTALIEVALWQMYGGSHDNRSAT